MQPSHSTTIFENGTIIGAMNTETNSCSRSMPSVSTPRIAEWHRKWTARLNESLPIIVVTDMDDELSVERSALLEKCIIDNGKLDQEQFTLDEFEQFVLNRTRSESNILETSICSELQATPSISGNSSNGGHAAAESEMHTNNHNNNNNSSDNCNSISADNNNTVIDMLNTSTCSRESTRPDKRTTRRKYKTRTKCNGAASATATPPPTLIGGNYPPQYTAIFLDHGIGGAANAMVGQLASAAASAPFLNPPVITTDATNAFLQQQYQYYQQQRPELMLNNLNALGHHHHRTLLDSTGQHTPSDSSSGPSMGDSTATTTPTSAINPPFRVSFRKWFSRPSLPFVIGILALGGVACTLGGIVLGSTGLIEHSTQYLSAALLMIGIGVSLLVISGAIWRLSIPDEADECPCYRHMETCRNCNSPYCNNRLLAGSYLYPEFQHRPPPPSYLTSLNECAAMSLLFHPAAQQAAYSTLRINTPPPLYRSTNSLSVNNIVPALPNSASFMSDHNGMTMSAVLENFQAQTQPFTKEINYLELD